MTITKTMSIFFKHQKGYLVFLFIFFVLPVGLFVQFSPYKIPQIHYVFLVLLIVSQYYYYHEKKFHRKIKKNVTKVLTKELGRVPSNLGIQERLGHVSVHRNLCILIAILGIIAQALYF